jgi:hypothetical protein
MGAQASLRASRAKGRYVIALGGGVFLLACQQTLPMAPSELEAGIIVYEHADYLGASAHITQDIRDLKAFKGPCVVSDSDSNGVTTTTEVWDDCVSSVRVAPGWWARLYRDDDFNGDRIIVTGDTPNLRVAEGRCDKGGFNDCATSIRLFRE